MKARIPHRGGIPIVGAAVNISSPQRPLINPTNGFTFTAAQDGTPQANLTQFLANDSNATPLYIEFNDYEIITI